MPSAPARSSNQQLQSASNHYYNHHGKLNPTIGTSMSHEGKAFFKQINIQAYLSNIKCDSQGTWQHELQIINSWKNSEEDFSNKNTIMISANSSLS